MSEICRDGVVILRAFDYGESSSIVVALTRSHGKVRLLAKGARKARSPFAGRLRTGNTGEIVFYNKPERGLQILGEIETRGIFDSGGEELEKMCILQAGLEVADRSVVDRQPEERVFDLVEGFIAGLASAADPWTAFFAFELLLLEASGHLPQAGSCDRCRRGTAGGRFGIEPRSGVVSCEACSGVDDNLMSRDSCEFIGATMRGGYGAVLGRKLEPSVRSEVGGLLHSLFLHHVEGYRLPRSLQLLRGERES